MAAEDFFDFADAAIEIGPWTVHFIDESKSGDFVSIGLEPDGFALRFDASDGIVERDDAIEHT